MKFSSEIKYIKNFRNDLLEVSFKEHSGILIDLKRYSFPSINAHSNNDNDNFVIR
jgi:hypothetical protein